LAAVRDGMDRGGAAKIGCMGRQTARNRVHQRKFVNCWKMGYHVADAIASSTTFEPGRNAAALTDFPPGGRRQSC
jgi:hypothetical protein